MQGPNQQKSIAKELMRNAPHKGTDLVLDFSSLTVAITILFSFNPCDRINWYIKFKY
jgi:hypothetical protein